MILQIYTVEGAVIPLALWPQLHARHATQAGRTELLNYLYKHLPRSISQRYSVQR